MKKNPILLFVLTIILFTTTDSKAITELNFFAGYNYSSGPYINDLNNFFPESVDPHGYSLGFEFWFGGEIELGFIMGLIDVYRFNNTLSVIESGDKWIEDSGESHEFSLNYRFVPLMFGLKFRLIDEFYLGGSAGYQLALSKPEIDNEVYSQYGDDGLISMVMMGYEFEIAEELFLGLNFRAYFGFSREFVNVSYSPTLVFSYRL